MRVENETVGDDLLLLLLLLQNQVSIMACLAVRGPVCCLSSSSRIFVFMLRRQHDALHL